MKIMDWALAFIVGFIFFMVFLAFTGQPIEVEGVIIDKIQTHSETGQPKFYVIVKSKDYITNFHSEEYYYKYNVGDTVKYYK